jgi:excisionase family DNA binding protein
MKAELSLSPELVEQIADKVIERLKPLLKGNNKPEDETIFDVKGLCNYLHVSDKWIYERTHLKAIPHLKVNGLLRFRKRDIDKWLNSFNVMALK